MSFYTKFADAEVVVTSTTTSILQSSDPILIQSSQQKKASQSTVGSVSVAGLIQSATSITTLSTGTTVPAQGVNTFTSTSAALSGTSVVWLLADPPAAGLCKTMFNLTTTTSTGLIIGFTAATGISTDVATGTITTVQFTAYGAYVELQALSTSQWLVIGRSAAGLKSS